MKKATYITEPRTFTVEGYTATVNIRFREWDTMGGRRSYCVSQAEVGKAIRAIAKAAGFNVLACRSQSYAGGDSVDIYVETELTPEQVQENKKHLEDMRSMHSVGYNKEPRADLLKSIVAHFEGGNFNSSEDLYEYKDFAHKVLDPAVDEIHFDTKYGFEHFLTKEEFADRSKYW